MKSTLTTMLRVLTLMFSVMMSMFGYADVTTPTPRDPMLAAMTVPSWVPAAPKMQEAPSDKGVLLFSWSYSPAGNSYATTGVALATDVFVSNLNFNFLGGVETGDGTVPTLGLGFSYQTTWNTVRWGAGLNVLFPQKNKIDFSIGFNLTLVPK